MAVKKKGKKANSKRTNKGQAKAAKRSNRKQKSTLTAKKRRATSGKKGSGRRSLPKATRVYTHREGVTVEPGREASRTGGQSGDLQGLRDVRGADSESVDELLEEGNAFEADVVAGVEHVEDDEEREVHTHEVPEDDVPEEYRDKD